jgi:hypothetical protein
MAHLLKAKLMQIDLDDPPEGYQTSDRRAPYLSLNGIN